jgi:hypothetical protein
MEEFLAQEFYGNTVEHYLITLGIIVGGIVVVRIVKKRILIQVEEMDRKNRNQVRRLHCKGIEKFGLPVLNIVVLYSSLHYLTFSEKITKIINNTLGVVITFYVIRMISAFVRLLLESLISKQEGGQEKLRQLEWCNADCEWRYLDSGSVIFVR